MLKSASKKQGTDHLFMILLIFAIIMLFRMFQLNTNQNVILNKRKINKLFIEIDELKKNKRKRPIVSLIFRQGKWEQKRLQFYNN